MNDPVGRRTRREARERALELAYEADRRELTNREIVAAQILEPDHYTRLILGSADDNRERIDELLRAHVKGWTLERLAVIDRLVMQLGTAELLGTDTPTGAVLSEAVALVGRYSTDGSSRFVNGVLSAVARDVRDRSDTSDPAEGISS